MKLKLINKEKILKIACKVCLSRFEIDEIYFSEEVKCPFCESIFKFLEDRIILFF